MNPNLNEQQLILRTSSDQIYHFESHRLGWVWWVVKWLKC